MTVYTKLFTPSPSIIDAPHINSRETPREIIRHDFKSVGDRHLLSLITM